jgi:hypothetical protein
VLGIIEEDFLTSALEMVVIQGMCRIALKGALFILLIMLCSSSKSCLGRFHTWSASFVLLVACLPVNPTFGACKAGDVIGYFLFSFAAALLVQYRRR